MRSQGTFEYILLLGGIIIVVLLVINSIVSSGQQAAQQTGQTITSGTQKITEEANNLINQINP